MSGLERGLLLLALAVLLPWRAAAVLRVGVLDGSPPMLNGADQRQVGRTSHGSVAGDRQPRADPRRVQRLSNRKRPAGGHGKRSHRSRVGCLTVAPERVGRYRFSLPFQEEGLALLIPTDPLAGGRMLLHAVLDPRLLHVIAVYLLVIALIGPLVGRDEHRGADGESGWEQSAAMPWCCSAGW